MKLEAYNLKYAFAIAIALAAFSISPMFAHAASFTATETVANVAGVKATRTLTVANALPGGTVSASSVNFTIGDCVVTLGTVAQDTNCTDHAAAIATTTDTTATLIASRLLTVTGIADTGRAGGLTLTASSSATSVVFTTTASAETAAGNITYTASTATNVSSPSYATVAGVVPVAQTVTFTPVPGVAADFDLTLNSTTYSTRASAGATVQEIVEILAPLADAIAAITCSEDNTKVTCVADTAGTSFTYASEINDEEVESSSSSNGSSGSSSSRRRNADSSSSNSSNASDMQTKIEDLRAKLATLMAKIGNTNPNAGMPVAAGIFAKDLTVGSTGADVKALQVWLNAKGFTVAATGAGSMGMETMTFGNATKAALAKYQAAKGIMPASGYFGPKTRAYVAANP
ncbi:MAG: putative cell-wall-anchored protein SasA [Parcubacteria bacterium C7867-004]|nr:MAG: putative cell-wall-anchored protein SasA [Parcubacteria bacterium C7867-004]